MSASGHVSFRREVREGGSYRVMIWTRGITKCWMDAGSTIDRPRSPSTMQPSILCSLVWSEAAGRSHLRHREGLIRGTHHKMSVCSVCSSLPRAPHTSSPPTPVALLMFQMAVRGVSERASIKLSAVRLPQPPTLRDTDCTRACWPRAVSIESRRRHHSHTSLAQCRLDLDRLQLLL